MIVVVIAGLTANRLYQPNSNNRSTAGDVAAGVPYDANLAQKAVKQAAADKKAAEAAAALQAAEQAAADKKAAEAAAALQAIEQAAADKKAAEAAAALQAIEQAAADKKAADKKAAEAAALQAAERHATIQRAKTLLAISGNSVQQNWTTAVCNDSDKVYVVEIVDGNVRWSRGVNVDVEAIDYSSEDSFGSHTVSSFNVNPSMVERQNTSWTYYRETAKRLRVERNGEFAFKLTKCE